MSEPERNFVDELRAIIHGANRREERIKPAPRLFNVHKRSLPVGIDRVVVYGATEAEADRWVETRLKPKCYENGPDASKTIIYFDKVPVGATPRERSVYHNAGPLFETGR